MLIRFLKNVFTQEVAAEAPRDIAADDGRPSVLNVGGNSKDIPIPAHYDGWKHLLLDIAPNPGVDVVLDARKLETLAPAQFDAIYCSHNLEHYFRHDCDKVLAGFRHVLKPEGFLQFAVPNMSEVFRCLVEDGFDIDDDLYLSDSGPITAHDVIYGLGREIESTGVDFFAHKRGFTAKSLEKTLLQAGFVSTTVAVSESALELKGFAFKSSPTPGQKARLGL